MSGCPEGRKSAWPEVVAKDGEAAKELIESETSGVGVIIVKPGSLVTNDIRCDRVRIFVDVNGLVYSEPQIG